MWSLSATVLVALLSRAVALVLKNASKDFSRPLDAFVIARNQSASDKQRWTRALNNSFSSLTLSDPVYLRATDIDDLLEKERIDPHYSSWFVPNFDRRDVMDNPKFPHELGCTLAHRSVWRQFVDRFDAGLSAPWAAVFESDAILREDFKQRATALRSQLTKDAADIILLGHCFEACPSSFVGDMDLGANVHVARSNKAVCTHAYLISERGARRLLGLTVPMKQAVDERIRAAASRGKLDSRSVCPPVSRQPWQEEGQMWSGQVDGATEFSLPGGWGSASDYPLFVQHLQNLPL